MKISSSTVAMSSNRIYDRQEKTTLLSAVYTQAQGNEKEEAAVISISEKSKKQMENFREEFIRQQEEQRLAETNRAKDSEQNKVTSKEEMMILTLKKILEALKAMREGRQPDFAAIEREAEQSSQIQVNRSFSSSLNVTAISGYRGLTSPQTENTLENGTWTRQLVLSEFVAETENTAFSSVGTVKTQDGKEVQFQVTVEMSRSFLQESDIFMETRNLVCIDPLVINLEGNIADVSNQKFYFDLDGDGIQDEISSLNKGSGFLALDKNEDGSINDGSELFGTKSGDGFADLATYDKDGNGWIDENDAIFRKLKIWTKNEDETNRLLNLKEAGVGALYLGNAKTLFHLNDLEDNKTNAKIQSTGVYLKENGEVGTIQHVDFTI